LLQLDELKAAEGSGLYTFLDLLVIDHSGLFHETDVGEDDTNFYSKSKSFGSCHTIYMSIPTRSLNHLGIFLDW
jgi:hypothetical protein